MAGAHVAPPHLSPAWGVVKDANGVVIRQGVLESYSTLGDPSTGKYVTTLRFVDFADGLVLAYDEGATFEVHSTYEQLDPERRAQLHDARHLNTVESKGFNIVVSGPTGWLVDYDFDAHFPIEVNSDDAEGLSVKLASRAIPRAFAQALRDLAHDLDTADDAEFSTAEEIRADAHARILDRFRTTPATE